MSKKKEKPVGRFETIFWEDSYVSSEVKSTAPWGEANAGWFQVIRDNETGVYYLRNQESSGGLTMAPLRDHEGKIMIGEVNAGYLKAEQKPRERVKDHSVSRRG